MSRTRLRLLALAVVALVLVAVAAAVLVSERSLVVIHNRSDSTLALSVETTNPGQFSWAGDIPAGSRVLRTARFSDNSFVVVCRDANGIHRARGGYVTSGLPQIVEISADSCTELLINVRF